MPAGSRTSGALDKFLQQPIITTTKSIGRGPVLRVSQGDTRFRVKAIAGTHVVLMAMDMDADTRKGLRGFAVKRGMSGQPQTFLRGIKFFEELVPHHDPKQDFSSRDQPFQTFLWSDYGDSGEQQRFIRTVSRRGFRFVGEVREQSAASPAGKADRAPVQEVSFCRTSEG